MRGLVWILCSALLLMPVTQVMAACCLNPAAMAMPSATQHDAEPPCHPGMAMPVATALEAKLSVAAGDHAEVTAPDCPHGGHCATGTLLLPGLAPQTPLLGSGSTVFAPPLSRLAAGWPLRLLRPPQAHS
jgi:hypothetical protein